MIRHIGVIILLFAAAAVATAQNDSVDVTFRYTSAGNPSLVHLPGEFNNWANNSGGSITPNARWTMVKNAAGVWEKTVRLKTGGGTGPGGSYQYKFNENGTSDGWLADPLNPRTFGSYGNSIIAIGAPTIFPLLPKPGGIVSVDTPRITAGIFPAIGSSIDTAATTLTVDGVIVAHGGVYDAASGRFTVLLPQQNDGEHTVLLRAADSRGRFTSDSTRFTVKAAPLQWLTRSNPRVYDSSRIVEGRVTDARITAVSVVKNGSDTTTATVQGDTFRATIDLVEGDNVLRAVGLRDGLPIQTESIILTRIIDHTPRPVMTASPGGASFFLSAVQSTDPDGDPLTFRWVSEDSLNPEPLGLDREGAMVGVLYPRTDGEYYIRLEARDPAGNLGIVRHYYTMYNGEGLSGTNDNPRWVRDAVVYEIFVPALSPAGTLRGVMDRLPDMADLGVNMLWLMPIMDNRGTVNEFNGGYDIVDLKNVDESLGTLADFRALVDACHARGMRVILDITPNHVSSEHPWVQDIRAWKDHSIYREYIENRVIGNARDLGQSVVSDAGYPLYARYSNWALPNLNLSNRATREAMLDVYRFWTREMRADGFRMDVYWGPQNRYGEAVWWRPFREEIKRIKPDILILGETDGTGPGSEKNYADGGGAMDAGYDWNWYGQIKATLSSGDVNNLMNRTRNFSPTTRYNHYTGEHSSYLRFLENHDEDRIAQIFASNTERTKPGAVVSLTAPGMPMIYAGQEIGWRGRRDKITFPAPGASALRAYYKKLIGLRATLPALRDPDITALVTAASATMAYVRPRINENVIVAASFSSSANTVRLNVAESALALSRPLDAAARYYLNDMLNDTTFVVTKATLGAIEFGLAPWQSRVLLLSDTALFPFTTSTGSVPALPGTLELGGVYPHPLRLAGDGASLTYTVPAAYAGHRVTLTVHDALGRVLARLAEGEAGAGTHAATIPAGTFPAAGLAALRLTVTDNRTGASEIRTLPVLVLP